FTVAQPQVFMSTTNQQGQQIPVNQIGTSGNYNIALSYANASSYNCSIIPVNESDEGNTFGQTMTRNCNNGVLPLNLQSLNAGPYQLIVQAVGPNGEILATSQENFCAKRCALGAGGGSGPLYFGNPVALGSGFGVKVPQGMHITEWSSSKT